MVMAQWIYRYFFNFNFWKAFPQEYYQNLHAGRNGVTSQMPTQAEAVAKTPHH